MASVEVHEIQSAYIELWEEFTIAAQAQGLAAQINAPGGEIRGALTNSGPNVHTIVYLPEWPYKVTSDGKSLDIIVQIKEEFALDAPEIVKSTSQVGYFEAGDGTPKE